MTTITILENVCAIINSDELVVIRQGENETNVEGKVAICRCGKSVNQPFCDGSHSKKEDEVKS